MPKRKPKRQEPTPGWVRYLRTSDKESQNPANSQERQRAAIQRRLLDESDLPFIDEYVDNFSGRVPKRTDYQQMLADARAGKFSHVAVENAERFGRNDAEALTAIDELNALGIKVRFADYPERDPVAADDRILISLSFTLARRESMKTGERVVGGMYTKVNRGGCMSRAPEGYINREERTEKANKLDNGRYTRWVEPHPTQFKVIREAFDLLLTDQMTLDDICEELHKRGYTLRSGKPFVKLLPKGGRETAANAISRIFHRWFYAGWVVSEAAGIPPKTIRGSWEPMLTTEEFERAQEILTRRVEFRQPKRKHEYLLRGMVFLQQPNGSLRRLNCQKPNSSRRSGGTPYYCVPRSNLNFPCSKVDEQVEAWILRLQVDPQHIPAIRAAYTKETYRFFNRPTDQEREQLETKLKAIDEQEQRTLRLVAKGMGSVRRTGRRSGGNGRISGGSCVQPGGA
jgi:DNA invertase Pin-like site-specific DNA recombinase